MNSRQNATAGPGAGAHAGGFTILETVIALLISLVVGLGAISLFLFSINYNAGASDRARALALAQQQMETLRTTPYANLQALDNPNPVPVTVVGDQDTLSDRRTFNVTTRVADHAGVPGSRQKVITVTVSPATNGGRWSAGDVTLRMYRASTELGSN